MSSAAQLRTEIETYLARRIPSALSPTPRLVRPTAATGIATLDELLRGGLPIGAISEIVGQESSGRTSLVLAFLSQLTQQGKVCAWIDVSDTLHPESAAAAGVDLERLLWVRCGGNSPHSSGWCENSQGNRQRDSQPSVKPPETARVQLGGNSPHPRSESKELPLAIGDLLGVKAKFKRDKTIGTPGAPNRPLTVASSIETKPHSREEQAASDRLPPRRGEYVLEQREAYEPRCAEAQHQPRPQTKSYEPLNFAEKPQRRAASTPKSPMSRLDQALRVADLLLQAGGFSAIVLDMGGIQPEFALRVPLATWFRYRAAAERTQSSFLLLTQHTCAKSSAGLVLRLDAGKPMEAGATVFAGLANHAELSRSRFEHETEKVMPIKKPPQSVNATEWRSGTSWTGRR